MSSSEEMPTHEENRSLQKCNSSSSSSNDSRSILYANRTFLTCRSPADAFFLCQTLQDAYSHTKQIRIRWCSLVDDNGDETNIDEHTRFKLDYEDTLDLQTILTGIPQVIRHADRTLSLKKQDIIETKRLLEKSIKGESISSDEHMNSTQENDEKMNDDVYDASSDDNRPSAVRSSTPKNNKRKLTSDSTRKQPKKKRLQLISGDAARKS
jgi:hypothetical protein